MLSNHDLICPEYRQLNQFIFCANRKGHDKGNLLDPIENQIEKKHNGLRGRFSKSSEPKLKTTHKNENRRNMSHSPFKLPSKSKVILKSRL